MARYWRLNKARLDSQEESQHNQGQRSKGDPPRCEVGTGTISQPRIQSINCRYEPRKPPLTKKTTAKKIQLGTKAAKPPKIVDASCSLSGSLASQPLPASPVASPAASPVASPFRKIDLKLLDTICSKTRLPRDAVIRLALQTAIVSWFIFHDDGSITRSDEFPGDEQPSIERELDRLYQETLLAPPELMRGD